MAQVSDAVKKCVAILQHASSDTEKFAALFMVTKLVKAKDCNTTAKKLIFEAIGFKFLKKLLLTSDVPVDCPPSIYKSVALSILTCFCNEPELATHPEMLANIPVFLDIVQQADASDYDDNLIIVGEAYGCLKSIASFEPGQKALFDVGAITKMAEIYSQQSFQTDEALNILLVLVNKFGANSWDKNNLKNFHALVNKIALDFETDNDERKFELCSILNGLLYNSHRKEIMESYGIELWPFSIYKGLFDVLTSKIGKKQRDPALCLASTMMDVLGVDWIFGDEEKGKQFFLLLIQLGAIEVRMQLDGKGLQQVYTQANLMTACYIILEISINYISTDQLDLDQKEKQNLYTGLKGAFSAVMSFLTKISNDKNKDKIPGKEKLFVCGTIRVLAAWLAQETSAMRTQVYQLLPFILGLANESFYACKARRLAEKAGTPMEVDDPISKFDVLRIMLPALCHLTVEDEARKIMLKINEDKALYDCFEYHWSIVHYKRPPVPRSERLKVLANPKIELSPEILEDMKDSRAAMISTCNIFMNITVLEAKYIEDSDLFNELMKFIFENLPELKDIPENLPLHGNLAVLGLLLMKQQNKKIKKNDFSICRYIKATIRFLWDAYVADESSDTGIVVAMSYKEYWMEIMELWFLGMQTMSAILSFVPWISEFAIESGWAEGIIDTLKKVKIGALPPNVKSAYEDFLCRLVDANGDVIPVLKKADALKVCRNHRLMELGKKLFGD
ncbi:PREDICTED: neurochondrin homolog [Nicrophorus vespilloides]|uniref:Neurochondrin homolog n=1 Tax=Nicrophorus vespilloides TaxID=110193 RepID=A0ABM1MPS5_NICVS|nr:PREDICTED: neurochondrin homolog [Nicrophorus vespilloides]